MILLSLAFDTIGYQQVFIQSLILRDDRCGTKSLVRSRPRGLSISFPQILILYQPLQGRSQRIDIGKWREQAGLAVLHDFGDAAHARRHARAAKKHGLQYAQAKTLGLRGVERDVGGLEVFFDFEDVFFDDDAVHDAEPLRLIAIGLKGAAGEEHQFVSVMRLDARDALQEVVDALDGAEIGGVQDHDLVVGDA